MRLLFIENDPSVAAALSATPVLSVANGHCGIDRLQNELFDLVILETTLPDIDGFSLCANLRQSGYTLPILMITPRRTPSDRVRGLRCGADDCIAKPFDRAELVARVEALRRRQDWDRYRELHRLRDIEVDFKTGSVFRSGKRVQLSEREFAVLRHLIENSGEVVTREQLLLTVWAYTVAPRTRTVDVHIASLRQKLEQDPRNPELIVTVHSQGYRIRR